MTQTISMGDALEDIPRVTKERNTRGPSDGKLQWTSLKSSVPWRPTALYSVSPRHIPCKPVVLCTFVPYTIKRDQRCLRPRMGDASYLALTCLWSFRANHSQWLSSNFWPRFLGPIACWKGISEARLTNKNIMFVISMHD